MGKRKQLKKLTIWQQEDNYEPMVEFSGEDVTICILQGITEHIDCLGGICISNYSVECAKLSIDVSKIDKDTLEKIYSLDFYVAGISLEYENEPLDFYTVLLEWDWQESIKQSDKSHLKVQFNRKV